MPVMPAQRFWRDTSVPRRKAHQTRHGYDATNQSCFLKSWRRHAFARLRLMQGDTNMVLMCSRNTTTKQKTETSICDRWQMTRPTGSLSLPLIGQMLGWDTWTILQKSTFDISQTAPLLQRNRHNNLFYLRSVDEGKRAPPLQLRPG